MKTKLEIGEEAATHAKCITERRLRRIGLTRTYYMTKLKALCEATKPISCIRGKEADGGTVDFIDVPDNQVQLGAVKEVIALYGDRAAEKVAVTGFEDALRAIYHKRQSKKSEPD